jgi:hypothetical protein
MRLKDFLAELRHRSVLKIATVYLGGAVVVLEVGTHLLHNFEAPHWVLKVFTLALIAGLPLACLMSWGFEFGPGGVHPAPPMRAESAPASRRSDAVFALVLLFIFMGVTAVALRQWRAPVVVERPAAAEPASALASTSKPETDAEAGSDPVAPGAGALPIVIIMDTYAPRGVYEADTREKGGTNADDLNDLLRDLPVSILKETIGATWEREDQLIAQRPALILVHRSGFFHAMNQEFGFAYPDDPQRFDETKFRRMYEVADNKLVAALGYIGRSSPATKFIVYSRGTGGDWAEEAGRAAWVKALEGRFPFLKGRVVTINVRGGPGGGSFDDPETAGIFREQAVALLGVTEEPQSNRGDQ